MQDQLRTSNEAIAARDATIENLKVLNRDISSQQKTLLDGIERLRCELNDEKKRNEEAEENIRALNVSLNELKTESAGSSKKLTGECARRVR